MSRKKTLKAGVQVAGSMELLTRSEVAKSLSVSVSTVRRMEGRELHPTVDDRGVHFFDIEQVRKLAEAINQVTETRTSPGGRQKLSSGDLAAEVFERLEQRQSLSEIVRALRVEPRKVRALYHEWRMSLERGEMQREGSAPPLSEQTWLESSKRLQGLLAQLPEGQPTRISAALGGDTAWSEILKQEVPIYDELGGFITHQPLAIGDIRERFGEGSMRITAYSLTDKRLLWEVAARI